ncbi:MAG: phosphoenolpyruvate carboxylase [Terrimicrobiaceae bacterium]
MRTTSDYIASGFEKIGKDLDFLMDCLQEVLLELGQQAVADRLPWIGSKTGRVEGLEQAFSIAFQLLNMVEESASTRTRHLREIDNGPADEPGLWAMELRRLRGEGLTAHEIAASLHEIRIEPVLTAHPTEAKRAAVLEQHRMIYRLLTDLENEHLTPLQREGYRDEIKVVLERLWRTGEILLEKPDIATERRGVLFYLREVFPLALARLDERLHQAWKVSGFAPALLEDPHVWPKLRFGTWVGGDRDGHPLVAASVTAETLRELRLNALLVMRRHLENLAAELPLSSNFQESPPALDKVLVELWSENPELAEVLARQHSDEPWRQYVLLLQAKLPLTHTAGDDYSLQAEGRHYKTPLELDAHLAQLAASLYAVGAGRLADTAVLPVRRALDVFGFHLAALDIRQNSQFHDQAMDQLLAASGAADSGFSTWSEERRLEFLMRELSSPRPFLGSGVLAGEQADAVLSCYGVLRSHILSHGREGVGSLIVSMTRRLSDLLVVYVLAREAGLVRWTAEGLVCELPVVPLFETRDDLEQGPGIIREFLAHPVTARSLVFQQSERMQVLSLRQSRPVQQVMIGYSDSNKDCGIFASQWALHRSQAALSQAGGEAGIKIRFFHGRGGTISRGAGPTHRFLDALPSGSVQGDVRLTEQGETIPQKYSNLVSAVYNLELLQAGVAGISLRQHKPEGNGEVAEICEFLSTASQEAYTRLIGHPQFMDYYSEATPIDALEISRIGSRPSRRTGQRSLADLRAIPWVFSWNQSRHYLPGWFGVGSALRLLAERHPHHIEHLSTSLKSSPFLYYVLTNVETNLASADREMMFLYAGLVVDPSVRDALLPIILDEFDATRSMLATIFGGTLEVRRPRMLKTLALRDAALRALHVHQTELLKKWRAARAEHSHQAEQLLPEVLLSINAIASGLRTTG